MKNRVKEAVRRYFFDKDFSKVSIMILLIMLCIGMTYYYVIRGIHVVFVHFFYVPVTLAGFYWGKRSVWVALLLGACLMAPYAFVFSFTSFIKDFSRVTMLIVVSLVTGTLRERSLCEEKAIVDIVTGNPVPTFVINKDHVVTCFNNACEALTKLSASEIIGTRKQWMPFYSKERCTLADLIVDGAPEKVMDEYYQGRCRKSLLIQGAYESEVFFPEIGENGRWLHITAAPLRNIEGKVIGAIETLQDITERKQAEETVKYQAYHDILTSLPNRLLFKDRLIMALAHARRSGEMLAVMFLDLDRFKNINDTLGHAIGDKLLINVSERLAGIVREVDTVARMGGDEFILILSEVLQAGEVARIAQKILRVFQQSFKINEYELYITASIGISIYPSDGDNADSLIKNADIAMYRAKDLGGNNYQFFTSGMNLAILDRLNMENSLRHALERKEFKIYYQPVVNIGTGEITGVEALIRWQRPGLGMVPPAEFIPLAEETGLIIPIGEWVMRTACAQNKAWQDAGFPPLHMAVNLSALQFRQHNFVGTVENILNETGLEPCYLELEITESIVMKDVRLNSEVLRKLREMGVRISLDDFGTGYSSLCYLKHFPVDNLKIDRSFVRSIAVNQQDTAIISAIVDIAHKLNYKVTVEGVETEEQLIILKQQQCDNIQGYLFSKPLPAREIKKLLKENKRLY
ncbi:MAG: EAL domain-containing protein [Firmicutes bacterium]|nr:EAL domain-containing protein [Bacillota bacterium]